MSVKVKFLGIIWDFTNIVAIIWMMVGFTSMGLIFALESLPPWVSVINMLVFIAWMATAESIGTWLMKEAP